MKPTISPRLLIPAGCVVVKGGGSVLNVATNDVQTNGGQSMVLWGSAGVAPRVTPSAAIPSMRPTVVSRRPIEAEKIAAHSFAQRRARELRVLECVDPMSLPPVEATCTQPTCTLTPDYLSVRTTSASYMASYI